MPGPTGYDVCRAVKASAASGSCAAARGDASSRSTPRSARDCGSDGHVTKPFDVARSCVERVETLLAAGTRGPSRRRQPRARTRSRGDVQRPRGAETRPSAAVGLRSHRGECRACAPRHGADPRTGISLVRGARSTRSRGRSSCALLRSRAQRRSPGTSFPTSPSRSSASASAELEREPRLLELVSETGGRDVDGEGISPRGDRRALGRRVGRARALPRRDRPVEAPRSAW